MPAGRALQAAVDVARADDDRDLDAALVHGGDLRGDGADALGIGAVVEGAHEGLARQLQQDPLERRFGGLARSRREIYSPTAKRAKRRMTTFSPVLARQVVPQLLDRLAVVLVGVDVLLLEQDDLLHPLAQLALDDLRADVLGLVGGLLLEDAQLGLARPPASTSSSET